MPHALRSVTPLRLPAVVAKLCLVFNLSRGGCFGKQLRDSAEAFIQMMNADSDLVRELMPLIAFDRGLTGCQAGLADEVLKELMTIPMGRMSRGGAGFRGHLRARLSTGSSRRWPWSCSS